MSDQNKTISSVHYLQSKLWADVKSQYGWKTEMVGCRIVPSGNITVYRRTVGGVGRLLYIPCLEGITVSNATTFTNFLKQTFLKNGFAVRIELNQPHNDQLLNKLHAAGWLTAKNHVQYRHTIHINLEETEENIWMNFKSRGRYEVLQAQNKGIIVEHVDPTEENLHKMYELMKITSARNKFFIRDKAFTFAYWRKFRATGQLHLFFAKYNGELIAGSVILTNGIHAWNKDGGSVRTHANVMAPRLIQWEVMKYLKRLGVITYDLGGIPDPKGFNASSIPGIYIFKSGFSKHNTTLMPTLELPLDGRYKLWLKVERHWLRLYNLFAHSLWW